MSKNTGNVAFRKIDVDDITDDVYREDDEVDPSPGLGPDDKEVKIGYLMRFTVAKNCRNLNYI